MTDSCGCSKISNYPGTSTKKNSQSYVYIKKSLDTRLRLAIIIAVDGMLVNKDPSGLGSRLRGLKYLQMDIVFNEDSYRTLKRHSTTTSLRFSLFCTMHGWNYT